ncbi:MAG TPA: hypothetical protein VG410_04920 [Solirubrobacteraceae bacterium]|nr:hypothetical protein [Solirubrobacteraceae bacterium]
MPTFCRHNRLVQNCPICAKEQSLEMRPLVSSATPAVSEPRERNAPARARTHAGGAGRASSRLRVRQLARGVDDGYHSQRVPGIRSSADAERLAEEMAFAARRLELLEDAPPGSYAAVAADGDLEERTWLAFLIAYLSPLDGPEPFAAIEAVRTSWASGELPELADVETGARTAHEPGRGTRTLEAYRAWAARAGGQQAAFTGEAAWPAERRFARVYERLALPGLRRDARYDLLVTLGRLGVYELHGGSLQFGGDNEVTVAAKRALGIGDPLLLERRAAELAAAAGVDLEALDLALYNWGTGEPTSLGIDAGEAPDEATVEAVRRALGL